MKRKLAHWLIRRLAARYGLGMTTAEASRFILYQDDYVVAKHSIGYSFDEEFKETGPYSFLEPDGLPLCSTRHPLSAQEPE